MGPQHPKLKLVNAETALSGRISSEPVIDSVESENIVSGTENGSPRLLIVDDDIVDRRILKRILKSSGNLFDIDEAESTHQALELCGSRTYDCVLLDFKLDEAGALELIPKLKQATGDGRQAIVLVTGRGNEYLAARAFKAGVHDYLVKTNLQPDFLVGAIEQAIEAVSIERRNDRHREELVFHSLHDCLTGLPNRKLFLNRLEQCIKVAHRQQRVFSVCSMDLDRFKQVNDTLGHEIGDEVLLEVSRRLSQTLRTSDTISRFGGDEFVAVLDIAEVEGSVMAAEKLVEAISRPLQIGDLKIDIGLSVGISFYPDCGDTAKELLRTADTAMYRAKKNKSGISLYTDNQVSDNEYTAAIATEISDIVNNDSLEIVYQPKVNIQTGKIVAAEALVRWRHPTLGLLPPVEFIPTVERTRMIAPMTYRITELVIRQCKQWLEMGSTIPVAVNLSARVLDDLDLPNQIGYLLDKWSLPAELLTLEVTETGALASHNTAAGILHRLSCLGVKISIDDFGSGYTSFRYLRDFSVDELKIDRMFVDDLVKGKRDESIIRSMLELGKGFGVQVVAEGIENRETLDRLRALNCQFGQGYYFSGPVSANKFLVLSCNWALQS